MLQIISGKFFTGNDRYVHDGKGITFTNYSWVQPIKTCVATLEPVDTSGSVASYVIGYTNQIEKQEGSFALVRTGDSDVVEQFELLCTFGLRAFFHQDRSNVAVNCRDKPLSSGDKHVPNLFVPRFFTPQLRGTSGEAEGFVALVDKVIALRRSVYLSVMACLRNFAHALQLVGHNIDLSYTLLVYSLESLSQEFDAYEPIWSDYRDEIRIPLEHILDGVPPDIAESIRATLLRNSNLKLQRRFTDFVASHVKDTFFAQDAPRGNNVLRKSELSIALRNAYNTRSQYVHQLVPIQEQLKVPQLAKGDVFRWDNSPYLNIAGLVRLSHHVIMEFIRSQDRVEREEIAWRDQLPGVVRLKMAPQYWIWKHEEFKPEEATAKLSGFLSQFETVMLTDTSLTDIRPLLEKYKPLLPNVKKRVKVQMLATIFLWNQVISPDDRMPNWEKTIEQYQKVLNECSIETMLIWLLTKQDWPWVPEDCAEYWGAYDARRFRKGGLSIPPLMELSLMAWIANAHKLKGQDQEHSMWMRAAVLDAAGRPDVQALLREAIESGVKLQYKEICDAAKEHIVQPSRPADADKPRG